MEVTWQVLALLALVALLAGCLDTLAGGGGLITVPALLLAGLPPLQALATNKLQAPAGTGMATYQVIRRHGVRWADVRWPMLWAFLGSVAGTVAILFASTDALEIVSPYSSVGHSSETPDRECDSTSSARRRRHRSVADCRESPSPPLPRTRVASWRRCAPAPTRAAHPSSGSTKE